jgi:quercetin dioxygenase-like cupin family protein
VAANLAIQEERLRGRIDKKTRPCFPWPIWQKLGLGQGLLLLKALLKVSLNAEPKSPRPEETLMKKVNVIEANDFSEKGMKKLLVHDSPYFKILNFNFKAGQELPVHAHDIEGQVSLLVLEGEGEFLGKDGAMMSAARGDVLISEIAEPHGIRARTDLRLLVTIAPPI